MPQGLSRLADLSDTASNDVSPFLKRKSISIIARHMSLPFVKIVHQQVDGVLYASLTIETTGRVGRALESAFAWNDD